MPRLTSFPEPDVSPDVDAIELVELAVAELVRHKGLSDDDLEVRVHEAARLARTATLNVHDVVVAARVAGVSWGEIARQLNMSRQAAQQRYGRDIHGRAV